MNETILDVEMLQRTGVESIRTFIEDEATLLDQRRYDDWFQLFAEDGCYWAPAQHGQSDWSSHVSLFFDDKHTMKTRIQRLKHDMIHCQEPPSVCVRVLSGSRIEAVSPDATEYRVRSKFIMLEDRRGAERRFFGGNYVHTLRQTDDSWLIVQKRVELTNCDAIFPMLTQPF